MLAVPDVEDNQMCPALILVRVKVDRRPGRRA